MIFRMYCTHDSLTGFLSPVLDQNDASAMRNFAMACQEGQSLMTFRPSDYTLYHIADFDSTTGELLPTVPPEVICRGDSFGGVKNA